jgi:hypothetical protein
MIIVNLKGGIGNQMFQYALGRKLALKNNDVLKIDTAGLARANDIGDIYRPFSLDAFNIDKHIATPEEVQKIKYPYGIVSKGLRYLRFKLSKDKNTMFRASVLGQTGDIFLDGYWQSPLYFNDIRDTLITEFSLLQPLSEAVQSYKQQIEGGVSVSIHVRRGDYAKNPQVLKEFGICEAKYYQAAIGHIKAQTQNPTFFVFSDDIEWVKENLPLPASAVFVKDAALRDVDELALMTICHHNIIANSSFSWWGAWLNRHEDKIVIAPTPWFEIAPFDKNLIPKTWIQIPKV